MQRLMITAALAFAVYAPALAQDKADIQQMQDKLAEALNKGDAAAAEIYAEDAHLLPPGAEMIQGRENIQKYWQAAMQGVQDVKLTTDDVEALTDEAVREIGSFRLKTKGEQAEEITGKYVIIWEKDGDDWQTKTDISNMNHMNHQ